MRIAARAAWFLALLWLVACSAGARLTVDVRTDYVPGEQFANVQTEVSTSSFASTTRSGSVVTSAAQVGTSYVDGVRVAEVAVGPGDLWVRVTLLDATGAPVAERVSEIVVTGPYSLTVVVSRSCDHVSCPPSGGDAALTSCQGGHCVDPRCAPDDPDHCGAADCVVDAQCDAAGECGTARCASGVCLVEASSASCASGERCTADFRCVSTRHDAGAVDAGPGPDAAHAPDASACGHVDEPCCGATCTGSAECVSGSCRCGGRGQVCCTGGACADGAICTDTGAGSECRCGNRDQVCCTGRVCDDGSTCTDTAFGPLCLCGNRDRVCCPGRVCDDGSTCLDTGFGPLCLCGTRDRPCCAGRVCDDGSTCLDTGFGPLCLCGTRDRPCCTGRVCDDGTTCTDTGFGPICR